MRFTLSPRRPFWVSFFATGAAIVCLCSYRTIAQQPLNNGPNNGPAQNFPQQRAAPFPGPQGNFGPAPAFGPNLNSGNSQNGQRGAAANADFDSLIDLIQATVAPESWSQ